MFIFLANPFHMSLSFEILGNKLCCTPLLKSRHFFLLVTKDNLWKFLIQLSASLKSLEIPWKWLFYVSIIIKLGISNCSILILILMSFVIGFLYKMCWFLWLGFLPDISLISLGKFVKYCDNAMLGLVLV